MSYEYDPEWTRDIQYPDLTTFVCPVCGCVPFNVNEVTSCLREMDYYSARHIPPNLTFTCGNPKCPSCDEDFEYTLSVVITARPSTASSLTAPANDGDGETRCPAEHIG